MSESSISENILAVTIPVAIVVCTSFLTRCTTANNEPAKQAEITIEAIHAGLVQNEKGYWPTVGSPTADRTRTEEYC